MNKVKRAIILAAGVGSRLYPVTLETPKPLIKINGTRMIDTIIDALYKNGINEIYIVVGYKKEKFNDLLLKYPNIKFIEDPKYNVGNNISSLYVARDYLEESFIMDADQIIYNDEILNPNFDKSGYNCVWNDDYTNEWLLTTDEKNIVKSCSRVGGRKGWQLYSVSRWSKEDGVKLKKYLEEEFINKKNIEIYWDDVALFCYSNEFNLTVYEMNKTDIVEVDNLQELIALDDNYKKYEKEGNECEK